MIMAQVIRNAARSQSFKNKRKRGGDEVFGLLSAMVLGFGVFGVATKFKSGFEQPHETNVRNIGDEIILAPKVLGTGSFGTVKMGKILESNEEVAIKVIKGDENFSMISNEVAALEKVKQAGGHENIVDYRYTVERENNENGWFLNKKEETNKKSEYWLLFEHIIGEELFDRVCKKSMKQNEATSLMSQVVDALNFLHNKVGLAHGDLKPENLLITDNGTVKLIDFGSAMPIQKNKSKNLDCINGTNTIGTVAYCSPEVLCVGENIKELTSSIDIWSLGIVLYVALSSTHPFDIYGEKDDPELAKAIINDPVKFDSSCWENVSADMKKLIQSMLEKNPEERITLQKLSQHPLLR